MIAFKNGGDSSDSYKIPPQKLQKLIKALMGHDPYGEASHHGGLSPTQIEQIIAHLMYTKNNKSINLIIDKEVDGYHLSLTIQRLEK
jgi:hypothetical protein